jgi:chromosome segregation ATPase
MSLDALPEEFEQLVDRARSALDREITAAKNIVAAAVVERDAAQAALGELQAQREAAKKQLDALNDELGRRITLAGVNREVTAARKALAALQAETAETTTALGALKEQRKQLESKLVALNLEANRMIAIRTEGEAVMAGLRAKLAQVEIGRRL